MEYLVNLDSTLFQLVNGQWHNGWLDEIAPLWRNRLFWIPLYLALAVYAVHKFRWRGVYFLISLSITAGLSDQISSKIIKPAVERLRPCKDPAMEGKVRLLVPCGGAYSFTSSHATNHFAAATFIFFTLGVFHKSSRWIWWIWAGSIAWCQVYVGVHYPGDVLAGSLLGIAIGFITSRIYLHFDKIALPDIKMRFRS
jgi:membrane-associated phospholipid phosphatase